MLRVIRDKKKILLSRFLSKKGKNKKKTSRKKKGQGEKSNSSENESEKVLAGVPQGR